jgi:hypothetical protein
MMLVKENRMAQPHPPINKAELMRRIEIARRLEAELLAALDGDAPLIAPSELPARIDGLGDHYQLIIIAFGAVLDQQSESPPGDSPVITFSFLIVNRPE